MQVFINPGAGAVDDATEANALVAIKHFVAELELEGAEIYRAPQHDEKGRFAFLVALNRRCTLVEMPGLPLDKVRYTLGMDPWQFPRLYVDGGSWLWVYALNIALSHLIVEEDEQ